MYPYIVYFLMALVPVIGGGLALRRIVVSRRLTVLTFLALLAPVGAAWILLGFSHLYLSSVHDILTCSSKLKIGATLVVLTIVVVPLLSASFVLTKSLAAFFYGLVGWGVAVLMMWTVPADHAPLPKVLNCAFDSICGCAPNIDVDGNVSEEMEAPGGLRESNPDL